MKIRYKKYSWWEDRMIMQYVNATSDNISYAFRCAAQHIDRSVKGKGITITYATGIIHIMRQRVLGK